MEYQNWLHKLLPYEFEIIYKPGVENKAADGLSRIHYYSLTITIPVCFALTIPVVLQLQDMYQEINESSQLEDLRRRIEQKSDDMVGYIIKSGFFVVQKSIGVA